jgi:hypothetical protein
VYRPKAWGLKKRQQPIKSTGENIGGGGHVGHLVIFM